MSNFLLRMVTRTAGLGPARGPRPRADIPGFLPPSPASPLEPQPQLGAPTRLNTSGVPQPALRVDVTEPGPHRSIDRLVPLPASESFDALKTEATPEILKQPTLAINQQISTFLPEEMLAAPQNRDAGPEISKPQVVVANHDIQNTIREVHTIPPAQVVPTLVSVAKLPPAKPAPVPVESQKAPRAKPDKSPPQPSLAETPAPLPQRPPQPRPALAVAGQPEPPVEVKIGRIEVHMEAAAAPAAPVPARPQGFAEYGALRRYQARPWNFRNR